MLDFGSSDSGEVLLWGMLREVVVGFFQISSQIGDDHFTIRAEDLKNRFGDGHMGVEDEKFRCVQEDFPVGVVPQVGVCRLQIGAGAGGARVRFEGGQSLLHI